MPNCTVCGRPAGLLMSMCDACIKSDEEARRERKRTGMDGNQAFPSVPIGMEPSGSSRDSARMGIGVASQLCSAVPALLTIYSWATYLFSAPSHALSEDMMGLGIAAVFVSPLALVGFVLALFARKMRNQCLALSMVYFVSQVVLVLQVG
jgi:hypothetical protein